MVPQNATSRKRRSEMADGNATVACSLGRSARHSQLERWRTLTETAGIERATTPDGLTLRFRDEPAVASELRALVAAERECCAWARWRLAHEHDALVLRVTADGAGVAALHALLA
jgi:hypothetical protein